MTFQSRLFQKQQEYFYEIFSFYCKKVDVLLKHILGEEKSDSLKSDIFLIIIKGFF